MQNAEMELPMLMESTEVLENVTIDFSPLYQDVNEEMAHEIFFQWRNDGEQSTFFDSIHKKTFVTFVKCPFNGNEATYQWTNPNPIDLSGLASLHRILMIRDITKRLRELDEQTEDDNKMLTCNAKTKINFKLEDTQFSLLLGPTQNQPGNALLTMQWSAEIACKAPHWEVETFDCFATLDAKEIDSIVGRARRTGKQITYMDIVNNEEDGTKRKIAEELTFFVLLYDFEVARRLQRPFVNDSQDFDSLPIGIGIAMMHHINRNRENQRWMFFSGLFKGNGESREFVLDDIVSEFKGWNEPSKVWTKVDLINILYEQFGGAKPGRRNNFYY